MEWKEIFRPSWRKIIVTLFLFLFVMFFLWIPLIGCSAYSSSSLVCSIFQNSLYAIFFPVYIISTINTFLLKSFLAIFFISILNCLWVYFWVWFIMGIFGKLVNRKKQNKIG